MLPRLLMLEAFFLPLNLNVATVVLCFCGAAWVADIIKQRNFCIKRGFADPWIFIFTVIVGISIFVAPDPTASYYNFYHLFGRYLALYFLMVQGLSTERDAQRVLGAFLVAGFAVVIYGFWQFGHGVDTSSYAWSDPEQFPGLKTRVFSTLENPNLLAGFLVVSIALAVGLVTGVKPGGIEQWAYLLLIAAMIACLILTYSRGAWLSLSSVAVAFGFLYRRRVLWLFIALLVIFTFFAQDLLAERILSIMNPTDSSAALRMALWESTIFMIGERPWLGFGWASYYTVYPDYDFFIQGGAAKIFHAHNMYLHFAAEIGVPGLISFLMIWLLAGRLLLKLLELSTGRKLTGMVLGILAALVSLLVSGLTDHILFNIQLSMIFWMLMALTAALGFSAGFIHPRYWINLKWERSRILAIRGED